MQMRAKWKRDHIFVAVITVHLCMNIVIVFAGNIITRIPIIGFTQNESHALGVTCMLFICSYEFLFEIIRWGALFLDIEVDHP